MRWEHFFASLADQSLSLPRFGHSAVAVADQAGSCQVVIYGGVGSHAGETTQTALGDVAVLQVDSGTWSAPDVLEGSSPGPRAFHNAVSIGHRMLVFGGHILTFDSEHNRKRRNFFNDVWQLDTVEWQWSKLPTDTSNPSSSPAPRDMAALLLLNDSSLLLFGGRSEQGRALQDTWVFDVNSCTWQQLKPEGVLPSARKMHSMVKVGTQVVLFGGERDNGPLDDLWVLAGFGAGQTLRWTQVKMRLAPAPRFGHAIAAGPAIAAAAAADGGSSRRSSSSGGRNSSSSAAPRSSSTGNTDPDASGPFAAAAATITDGSSGGSSGGAGDTSGLPLTKQHVVLFGGCLDLSTMFSLNKNYVQSKETWLLELDKLTWMQLPAPGAGSEPGSSSSSSSPSGAASSLWPCERMCHSLTALPDGRLLMIGGRNKEGICRDMWYCDTSGDVPGVSSDAFQAAGLPPASPRPSTAGSTGSATSASGVKASSSRPGSQSLLQSLLGPVRSREGLIARRDSSSQGQGPSGPSATPPASTTPNSSQPPSPKRQQQQQTQPPPQQQQQQSPEGDLLQPLESSVDAQTAVSISSGDMQQQQQPQQGVGQTWTPAAAAAAAASNNNSSSNSGNSSSSSQQPLASLMDVSSAELAKLIKNPAAYSAGAINKFSSSVTSTVSSLLVGREGQTGPLPRGILPEALMRVAPNWASNPLSFRGGGGAGGAGSSQQQQEQQGMALPGMSALRQQMGLSAGHEVPAGQAAAGQLKPPGNVLQELAALGQELLVDTGNGAGNSGSSRGTKAPLGVTPSGSFTANSNIPADVLVSAARQHLMSADVGQLHVQRVVLLLADYQQLAAAYYAQVMLSRLSDGFSAAAAASEADSCRGGSQFMQRQPSELLLNQVQQLQLQYRQLLLESAA